MSTAVLAPEDREVCELIVPDVSDEWGTLTHAAVYDSHTPDHSNESHLSEEKNRIREEHRELVRVLLEHGVTIVPIMRTKHDEYSLSVFCRDQLIANRRSIVLPDTLYRNRVIHSLRGVVDLRTIRESDDGAVPEGGDIVYLNRSSAIMGVEKRRNQGSYKRQSYQHNGTNSLALLKHTLTAFPHAGIHVDCTISALPPGVRGPALLYSRHKAGEKNMDAIFPAHQHIPVPAKEDDTDSIASNILWLSPEQGLASDECPRTNQLLRDLGYNIDEVSIPTIAKMSGGVRCCVAPIVRT